MGRRKIEIKAIKDDRNRSVTFLKRKGGLFKKAHELSVLCSVDVAVFIFGSNKKLYEYSSCDMRELISRYTYHGGPNEHKGPSDFNGGADEDGSDDENGTPPQGEGLEPHMTLAHFHGQPPYPHPHMRHHTPSASPPITNGAFVPHPGHPIHRGHTPQPPHMGSRPSSRNDIRRMAPAMGQPNGAPAGHQGPQVNGYAYMPQPAIYNPQTQPTMNHGMHQSGPQYPYAPPQAHNPQMQSFMEDQRRSSLPPNFPPPGPQQAPPQIQRQSVSPPQPPPSQLPPQPMPHMSPPPPQHHPMQSPPLPQHQQQQQQQHDEQQRQQQYQQQHQQQQQQQQQEHQQPPQVQVQEPLAPPPPDVKSEPNKSLRQPLLLDTGVKRLPQRKGGSIFTPIDGPSSILAQHLSAFNTTSDPSKSDSNRSNPTSSPPQAPRSNTQTLSKRQDSIASIPERTFTPPSRTNSLQTPGGAARPRLKVQIPEEASEAGSATAGSSSPRNTSTDATSQHSRGIVLPPPSPSTSTLLSAGASGPPNPFARPPPQQQHNNMNIDTPVSALPSRMMGNEFLPSPSSFYTGWDFRASESNTLASPLNFATPVVGTGPSFLRDDPTAHKRKSPEISGNHGVNHEGGDAKRVKTDA